MSEDRLELKVIFHGKVQGVFFRAEAKRFADSLGISGWVKNLPNGTVELLAQGSIVNLEKLLDSLCGPAGPGQVTFVEQSIGKISQSFSEFKIEYQ